MSFLLFLGDGLRGDGLGVPSPLLGGHSSCCRGKSGSGECGLGAVRGGRHGRGVWECRLLSCLPSYSEASGAGRALVMDVLVIIQLMFLQFFENVEVPQIPFPDRVLQIPVVLQSRVRTVQTVQKPEMPQRSSWSGCSRARCYAATVAWGWTVPKTVEVPQLQLVQFLEFFDTPVVLVTTGACAGPDSAAFVETLQFWTRLSVCRWCAETVEVCSFISSTVWFTCLPICNDWCQWSRQCSWS